MRAVVALLVASLVSLVAISSAHSAPLGLDAAGSGADARLSKIERAAGVCADRIEDELHYEQMIRLVLRDESIVPGRYRGIEDGRLLLWQSPDDDENGELLSQSLESIQRVHYYTRGWFNPEWPLAGAAIGLIGGALVYGLTDDDDGTCGEPLCGLEGVAVAGKSAGVGMIIGLAISPFLPNAHKIACFPNERRRRLE